MWNRGVYLDNKLVKARKASSTWSSNFADLAGLDIIYPLPAGITVLMCATAANIATFTEKTLGNNGETCTICRGSKQPQRGSLDRDPRPFTWCKPPELPSHFVAEEWSICRGDRHFDTAAEAIEGHQLWSVA